MQSRSPAMSQVRLCRTRRRARGSPPSAALPLRSLPGAPGGPSAPSPGSRRGAGLLPAGWPLQSAVIGALELTGSSLQAQGEEGAAEAGEGVPPVGPAAPLPGTAAVPRGLDAGINRDGPAQPATAGATAGGAEQRGRRQRALPSIAQLYAPPDCCHCLRDAHLRLLAALHNAEQAC